MKKISVIIFAAITAVSCNKIEETVTQTVNSAKEKVQQKTEETIQNTVNEQLNKFVNAETVKFDSIFTNKNGLILENETGKKVMLPTGSEVYVFKYKTADKDLLLNNLVAQPTSDETKSSKEFSKVDGASIIQKIAFLEKFLPENIVNSSFFEDIKNDKNLQYYKIKRFPNSSTIIYNPKTQIVYQFVEVKK